MCVRVLRIDRSLEYDDEHVSTAAIPRRPPVHSSSRLVGEDEVDEVDAVEVDAVKVGAYLELVPKNKRRECSEEREGNGGLSPGGGLPLVQALRPPTTLGAERVKERLLGSCNQPTARGQTGKAPNPKDLTGPGTVDGERETKHEGPRGVQRELGTLRSHGVTTSRGVYQ